MPDQPTPVRLLPRQLLFGNPDRAGLQLSPDGQFLAFLAPHCGQLNVWVGPAGDPSQAEPVTADTERGIVHYGWTHLPDCLVYLRDAGGDENYHLYQLDLKTKEAVDRTPCEGARAGILSISHKHPERIVFGLNNRRPEYHDPYLLDLVSGERTLLYENNEWAGFELDDDHQLRYAVRVTEDGGTEYCRLEDGEVHPYLVIPQEDTGSTRTLGLDGPGTGYYAFDSRGRDLAALVKLDGVTGEQLELLAEARRADLTGIIQDPIEKTIHAVAEDADRLVWQALDDETADELAFLQSQIRGDLHVTSQTLDNRRWIVSADLDDGPVKYYHYDRDQRELSYLFCNRQALEGAPLARTHPLRITARDGLELPCYLTLPPWLDPDATGRPTQPVPLVLWVHGGPWARDRWGCNSTWQWLANRGYAVMNVNYRGSTGFGKAFVNASNLQWAGTMHDDLLDVIEWAIAEGITTREQVAIGGGSYGGYATLVGLTFTPEVFCCGVDIVGPSNLRTLLESVPPYWKPMLTVFRVRVGDPDTDEGRALLEERSPLRLADRICKPLLIGQGANDPRVKQAESDRVVAAMEAKGIPVTYLLYPDEGHGFQRNENMLSFFAVAEAFFAEHLGGRFEPLGDALEGSSLQVKHGLDGIPGLAEVASDRGV